jgi:hypothetical protein
LAILKPPDDPGVGQLTIVGADALGIDILGPLRLGELVGGADTPASAFVLAFASLLATSLLPLLFGTHGEGFIDLGGTGSAGQLFFEFGDPLLEFGDMLIGGVELTLDGSEQINEPIGIDPTGAYIFLSNSR